MRLDHLLLVVFLALAVISLGILLDGEVREPDVEHPSFPSMRHADDSSASGVGFFLAWCFGTVSMMSFVALMAFGMPRTAGARRATRWWFGGGLAAYLGAWVWLALAYLAGFDDSSPTLYLGLPAPSAVMIYVLFPVSILFNLLFVCGFRGWVLSPQDEADYERLLSARRAREDTR